MKKQKRNNGITLIALIVTIIVLLILAGVSIAMLTGENGLLTQTQKAKINTEKTRIMEQVQLDILSKQTEKNGTTLYKEDIKAILDKYFETVSDNYTLDTELQTKEEYGNYQILVSEIYSGELVEKPIFAKDVLVPNESGETAEEKSPYVIYNNILCRVLYNDEIHGLQIVSNSNTEVVELGLSDTTVTGLTEDVDIAMASYNNAVDTLNNKAKEYIGTKAIDARCLGSIATLKNGKFQGDTSEWYIDEDGGYLNEYKLKDEDTNYEEDENQILKLNIGSYCWLASRSLSPHGYGDITYFGVKILSGSSGAIWNNSYSLGSTRGGTYEQGFSLSYGIRPVILLPDNIVIISGDGSKENPYIIE